MEELKSLPDWFKGELYTEGDIITNPITSESYELNAQEFSMYHFIIKLESTRISEKNVDQLTNALIWFVANNSDAYHTLLFREMDY